MPMARVDLNCDLGEEAGHDTELMPLITSANIACGAHAGDRETMRATVELAKRHGVAIGAHPGFADRENFGRREIEISPAVAAVLVGEQVQILRDIAVRAGTVVSHVKLHGALYNMVSRDKGLAEAVVNAIWTMEKSLGLFVLSGSELERVARGNRDLNVTSEVFADRTYQADGSLTPRVRPAALINDEDVAVAQVLRMVRDGVVRATDGTDVRLRAETICLHGDGPHPVAFAQRLNRELRAAGVAIQAPGQ